MGGLGLLIFHHGTKSGAKMLIDAQIIWLKTKFKMAAAAILNLLPVAIFDIHPTFHC